MNFFCSPLRDLGRIWWVIFSSYWILLTFYEHFFLKLLSRNVMRKWNKRLKEKFKFDLFSLLGELSKKKKEKNRYIFYISFLWESCKNSTLKVSLKTAGVLQYCITIIGNSYLRLVTRWFLVWFPLRLSHDPLPLSKAFDPGWMTLFNIMKK